MMPECYYKKEPLDMRLIVLRLLRQWRTLLVWTIIGTIVFGGGYYLRYVVLPPTQYAALSLYYVTYETPPDSGNASDRGISYINHETWNRWLSTDEFLDILYEKLDGTQEAAIDRKTMKSYLSAELLTDHRMPDTIVMTSDPEISMRIAAGVEQAIVEMIGAEYGIEMIRVVDHADETYIYNNARPMNALILAASLSFLAVVAFLLLKEIGSDSIWLPGTLTARYGLKSLGAGSGHTFSENVCYVTREKKNCGVLPIGELDILAVTEALQATAGQHQSWTALPDAILCPAVCGRVRELDGLVLAVKAGAGSGKRLEELLELLRTQDCRVDGAFLWDEDAFLIKWYYWRLSQKDEE